MAEAAVAAGGAATGNGAGGAAAVQPPGGAPAAATGTTPAGGAAAQTSWMDAAGVSAENRGHVMAKGANNVNDIIGGWKAAEQLIGVPAERRLTLPADPKGFEDFAEVYSKLGAPAEAKDYGLTPEAGTSPEFTNGMAEILKAARVTKDQAGVLVPKYDALVKTLSAAAQEQAKAKAVADKQALSVKWGAAHDQNTAVAKGVARKFSMSEEAIRAMDSVTGHTALMEFLFAVGRGLGEHNFVEGQPGPGLMLPDQAKTEREAAMADKSAGGWTERYLKGGTKEKTQMSTWLAAEAGLDMRDLK